MDFSRVKGFNPNKSKPQREASASASNASRGKPAEVSSGLADFLAKPSGGRQFSKSMAKSGLFQPGEGSQTSMADERQSSRSASARSTSNGTSGKGIQALAELDRFAPQNAGTAAAESLDESALWTRRPKRTRSPVSEEHSPSGHVAKKRAAQPEHNPGLNQDHDLQLEEEEGGDVCTDTQRGDGAADKACGIPAASERKQHHTRDEDDGPADVSESVRSLESSPELTSEKGEDPEDPLTWDMEAKHEHWKFCAPEAWKQDGQRIFGKMSALHQKLLEQRQAVSKQRNQVTSSLEDELKRLDQVEETLNNKRAKVQQQLQPLLALAGGGFGL